MKTFASSMADALRHARRGNPAAAAQSLQRMMITAVSNAASFGDTGPSGQTGAAADRRSEASPPARGTIVEKRYSGDAGTLSYRLYLPADSAPGMPVLIMLHGCTQSAEDFSTGTGMDQLADEFGVIVAYPRQTQSGNAQKCWNWFRPDDQRRDRGEPALIAGIARQVVADRQGDAQRVYVAGLSAGGAAAAVLGDQYPDLFAAVGIHSGIACGAARDLSSALATMKTGNPPMAVRSPATFVPTIAFHGDQDMTVHAANARNIIAAATAAFGSPLTVKTETGQLGSGRRYTRTVSSDSQGHDLLEQWTVHGSGHAWSGGRAAGSYTDPLGPDASREMLRFFLAHRSSETGETSA